MHCEFAGQRFKAPRRVGVFSSEWRGPTRRVASRRAVPRSTEQTRAVTRGAVYLNKYGVSLTRRAAQRRAAPVNPRHRATAVKIRSNPFLFSGAERRRAVPVRLAPLKCVFFGRASRSVALRRRGQAFTLRHCTAAAEGWRLTFVRTDP